METRKGKKLKFCKGLSKQLGRSLPLTANGVRGYEDVVLTV